MSAEMTREAADAALRAYAKDIGRHPSRGRFYVENIGGRQPGGPWAPNEWQVVDNVTSAVIGFDRKSDCEEFAHHMRDYVKLHGDVSLYSAPNGWDAPFTAEQSFENRHMGCDPTNLGNHWNLDRACVVDDCACHLIIPVVLVIRAIERAGDTRENGTLGG